MRPIVTYDDLAPVNGAEHAQAAHPPHIGPQMPQQHSPGQRPAKKRRQNGRYNDHNGHGPPQGQKRNAYADNHWDDPGNSQNHINYDEQEGDSMVAANGDHYDGEEESRELTHDEIWDDSALIDAWNSANDEYEVCSPTVRAFPAD